MPPKRAAKAKAKAGILRRPAARERPMRRPGAGREGEEPPPGEATKERLFEDVKTQELLNLGPIAMQSAVYYGRKVAAAGRLEDVKAQGKQLYGVLKVTGTKDEELVRILSGKRPRHLSVHLCDAHCSQLLTDETLIHSRTFEPVDLEKVPWLTCLEEVRGAEEEGDEMEKLRAEQERHEGRERKESEDRAKKKRKRKERKEKEEGRNAKSPKRAGAEKEVGQKELDVIFAGTGLDPEVKQRRRMMRRAKKVGRKKGKKKKRRDSSSSGSSSGTTSSSSPTVDSQAEGLFDEEMKLKQIWRKCPGILTYRALSEARHSLVTGAGTIWEVDKAAVPPLFVQYGRTQLLPSMGPVVQQECLTLTMALDCLLQGHVARGMDVLAQRVKALETIARGGHWTVARQLELVNTESQGMSEQGESPAAARAAREQERLRTLVSRAPTTRGVDYSQGGGGKTRKGKEKGTGKGASNEGGKGKSGQGGKEEGKGSWQKKKES